MNLRQRFEQEFPGCTGFERVALQRRLRRKWQLCLHNQNRELLCFPEYVQQRMQNEIRQMRMLLNRTCRNVEQMEFNWEQFRLALTDEEIFRAELIDMIPSPVVLKHIPSMETDWKQEGF